MKLSRSERWMLSNQYRMLSLLDEENAESYDQARYALDHGFEGEYANLVQHVYDDADTLSEDACDEVWDILGMFDDLRVSAEEAGTPPGVEQWHTSFIGFDGNDRIESKYGIYAEYICSEDRFADLKATLRGFNSHGPTLEAYRRMLKVWLPMRDAAPGEFRTADEIANIAAARGLPSGRNG